MKQSRQENIIYLIVWGLLFAAPLLSLYVRTVNDATVNFDWSEVFIVWHQFAVYLALFLMHNFLLAPLLIHGNRRGAYFSIMAVVIAVFTVYQCNSRPEMKKPLGHRPSTEQIRRHRPPHFDEPPMARDGERPALPPNNAPPHSGNRPPRITRPADAPPPIVGEHDIMAVVVLILMLGVNLGIKGYFHSRDDRKRLAELEHENLEQQLEYLRYQIHPHFFMNTLNNIHALVDIDPEKAKDTILELSKMMRFLLYEGNKQGVPLSREIDFIRHYVALMQLRYTDKVRITLNLPTEVPNRQIPPLILITFIENAFKHGVSYQRESFIEAKVVVENDGLQFSCRNSKSENSNEEKGGVGLANVRKRLNLLYGNNYDLRIRNDADVYSVKLNIPLL
ncbi:MAG: histidine kinase [Bacteroidaceae bacterium]|nr:histidine kinase [Bacteroidaceae bacterium]